MPWLCFVQNYQEPLSSQCNYPPIQDESADVIKVRIGLRPNVDGIKCIVKGPEFSDSNRDCQDPESEGGVCQPAPPTHIEARMCYSKTAYAERPWRKKNRPYPEVDCVRVCIMCACVYVWEERGGLMLVFQEVC